MDEDEGKEVYVSVAFKGLERARIALRKAIASEGAKYNPSEGLLRAFEDGLKAIGG